MKETTKSPRTGARGKPGHRPGRPAHAKAKHSSPKPGAAADEATLAPEASGLRARRLAVALVEAVTLQGHAFDEALDVLTARTEFASLEPRDRGFARLIAATVLRRLGSLGTVIGTFLEKPMPATATRARSILLIGAAQLLILGTPAHAAINLAVAHCQADQAARRFDKLTNAVLRKVATQGPDVLAKLDRPRIDVPDWLWARWVATYGEETARRIGEASLMEAPLDLSVKGDAAALAAQLGAMVLDTGSLRLVEAGRIEELADYAEGSWWVQDAAAALPARLLGDVTGLSVADLCAAPGGKTASLAARGARVTAVDQSAERLKRLDVNMVRLGLQGTVKSVAADLKRWTPDTLFDALLLDAPCTATGTIRRHPDILHLKRAGDVERLATLQGELLDAAARMVKAGGRLVYCVCSLEREEGEGVVEAFLARNSAFRRVGIVADELAGHGEWITAAGDLRTLPFHSPAADAPGLDGFFAARLERRSH